MLRVSVNRKSVTYKFSLSYIFPHLMSSEPLETCGLGVQHLEDLVKMTVIFACRHIGLQSCKKLQRERGQLPLLLRREQVHLAVVTTPWALPRTLMALPRGRGQLSPMVGRESSQAGCRGLIDRVADCGFCTFPRVITCLGRLLMSGPSFLHIFRMIYKDTENIKFLSFRERVGYHDIFQNQLIAPKLSCEVLGFDIFITLDLKTTPWEINLCSLFDNV